MTMSATNLCRADKEVRTNAAFQQTARTGTDVRVILTTRLSMWDDERVSRRGRLGVERKAHLTNKRLGDS